jgi:5-(carboxyamino)imidazole ribonucleotide synthase
MSGVLAPGSRIGLMGGGQLGRMFILAARSMGYRVSVFVPEDSSPAGQVADEETTRDYLDEEAVRAFARSVDVLTFEFENIPQQALQWASEYGEVRPRGEILHTTQNRAREKEFLAAAGFPLPAWANVATAEDLAAAARLTGYPAILKTASFGYDGKGQQRLESDKDARQCDLSGGPFVLEAKVPFAMEVSVIVARGSDGQMVCYPVCENMHRNHILDTTVVPARVSPDVAGRAEQLARAVAAQLHLVGVLAVEMFLLPDGTLLINELAPRPHNSGHFSIDACVTSQFEQQVRAVCQWPLGSPELLRPCAMANLLGDLWAEGEPNWAAATALGEVKIHLYGKAEPRPGRKMGHPPAFGSSPETALARVMAARHALPAGRRN